MTSFLDFLHQRLEHGGFTTEDVLASMLPVMRQAAAAHRTGKVAPLAGVADLQVQGVLVWYEESKAAAVVAARSTAEIDRPLRQALDIVGETRWTSEAENDAEPSQNLLVGTRGTPVQRPIYLSGYVSWEHEVGHHDPLTDIFSLGMLLASLSCGLDFNEPDAIQAFVDKRRNLFDLNAALHPVLAKAIVRMTELSRHRRPQDLQAVIHTLENYRDQDIDFDFDLARIQSLKTADVRSRRGLILGRLQQRLFEMSRRNRLLHFRPTMQTVNLTWASVPLSFDVQSIRPEQILTCNAGLQKTLASGNALPLNKHLRFEEAIYLPSVLDEIRTEARRDQAEFGFAQLRLVLCFLRWSNLKEKPPERFDSPLVLLPVQLTKTKGVRDIHALEPLSSEAEVNPILRHCLKQLYNIDLPESIDLATTPVDTLHEFLAAKIQASEPAVTVVKIDRPRINLVHAKAKRRLDQYQRRVRLAGRGVRSFQDLDYSYDRDNYHPLGLRLFQARLQTTPIALGTIVDETPRPRSFMAASAEAAEKERLLYSVAEEETNPYQWEFDLCSVTLGNFRYRKMSLVRDYEALLAHEKPHAGFEAIFSQEPRPNQPTDLKPLPLEECHPIVACDPTQTSAVALARTGRDYIIQGPPGTGKSQTITNLIADFIVRGKRVLFVCEKRAAIDVVFHRMKQSGLEDLCCLIHDSQADKKAFVMDLKGTYERSIEARAKPAESAEKVRSRLLATMQKELAPLQRFDEAMRSTPAEARIPLRRLLERALELEPPQDMTAAEVESIPHYALWHEHRERLAKIAATIQEVQGDPVYARHPLRRLHARFAKVERPLEEVNAGLEASERLLDALESQLETLELPEGAIDSTATLGRVLAFVAPLRSLAEHEQLDLLKPKSDLAKQWVARTKAVDKQTKLLNLARETTKPWRHKLPPAEVVAALEQAKAFEGKLLRFLQPGWWRLRQTMRRCYDFGAHNVSPSWRQVLEGLQREYELAASLDELEADAQRVFHFSGTCTEFAQQVEALRTGTQNAKGLNAELQKDLLAAPEGHELILQLLKLQPVLEPLESTLGELMVGGRELTFAELRDELALLAESLDDLPDFVACLADVAALPAPLARAVRDLPLAPAQLEAQAIQRSLGDIYRADRTLARFQSPTRARCVQRLEKAHDQLFGANAAAVQEGVRQRFLDNVAISSSPQGKLNAEQKEFKTEYNRGRRELEHEFGKTMRYKSIRDLVAGASGLVIQDLKPVWLMSPLSVSDTLPLDAEHFDVVIFDEASQVTLEEAVPSIFRAQQVIVVGDEMQLPPTNFFSAKRQDEDDESDSSAEDGARVDYDLSGNSFLNHAARRLPATMLGWHYRSRSESLISFSNAAFYQSRLLTVPEVALPARDRSAIRVQKSEQAAAQVDRLLARPVSFHLLEHGVYVQRRNTGEADYIAHLVRELLRRGTGLTIGIVAFSEAQQDEIDKALRNLARDDEDFRTLLDAELEREQDNQFVGLLVKNLENIQGDERDIVIISVCYAPGPNGKMLMNFGPINQSGGERRLNVAFSRAKKHMALVSSVLSPAITNDYNDGARCLKNYLRYAEAASCGDGDALRCVLRDLAWRRDAEPTAQISDAVVRGLASALGERGYLVDLRLGQSHFRCDLAVRRPDDAAYRLGIIVDTESYYAQTDLVERDVLRPKLLRAFGWTIAHVLAKDWHERRGSVLQGLESLLAGETEDVDTDADDERSPPPPLKTVPAARIASPSPGKESAPVNANTAATSSGWSRYLEFEDGASRKFWEITVSGQQHTVRFGRIGAPGQRKTKSFDDAQLAERDAQRLIREKLAKGYSNKGTDAYPERGQKGQK